MRAVAAAVAVAAAAALAAAPAAEAVPLPAKCRAVNSKIRQPDSLAPLVVGDSVTVSAGKYLAQLGFSVDAVACRAWVHGLEAMASKRLPDVVVVALGSNGVTTGADLERALELVGPFGRLVLVLPVQLGGGADPDGRVMRAFQDAHPDQVELLDWPAYSGGHGGWFQPDGLHLTTPGAEGFARMIGEGVEFGQAEQVKPPVHYAPRKRSHRRAQPPEPELGEIWRRFGRLVAAVAAPGVHLLEAVIGGSGSLGRQDL